MAKSGSIVFWTLIKEVMERDFSLDTIDLLVHSLETLSVEKAREAIPLLLENLRSGSSEYEWGMYLKSLVLPDE